MSGPEHWLGLSGFSMICFVVIYFVASAKMFENGELYASTPEYDLSNVKAKHRILRVTMLAMIFIPFVALVVLREIIGAYASAEILRAYNIMGQQLTDPYLLVVVVFVFGSYDGVGSFRARFFEEPYILTRYMIYPKLSVSAGAMTGIVWSFAGGIAGFAYSFFESNITIRNGMDFPFGVLCFVMELLLVYLANYAVIGWYDNTSNDFLFDKVSQEEYDKAAKRYYGIWRNRLILANVVVCAQLILGGFVTLTNAGAHLAGIRIFGLVILAAVFIYILIQGRDFDDPVVVGGMVYPSEKKRATLKWVILSAIALYILGAVILL